MGNGRATDAPGCATDALGLGAVPWEGMTSLAVTVSTWTRNKINERFDERFNEQEIHSNNQLIFYTVLIAVFRYDTNVKVAGMSRNEQQMNKSTRRDVYN
jgi:hypothetical protein